MAVSLWASHKVAEGKAAEGRASAASKALVDNKALAEADSKVLVDNQVSGHHRADLMAEDKVVRALVGQADKVASKADKTLEGSKTKTPTKIANCKTCVASLPSKFRPSCKNCSACAADSLRSSSNHRNSAKQKATLRRGWLFC